MITDLNDYPLWSIFLASFVSILAASEIGRRLGVRAIKRAGDNVTTLEGAILGLLARIMHHMTLFCTSGELTRAVVPSGGIGVGNS